MSFGVKGNHKRTRRHPGVKGLRPDLKAFRRREAQERQKEYDTLSLEQRLELLNSRRGTSAVQRARLLRMIEMKPVAKPEKQVSKLEKRAEDKPEKQVQKFLAKYKSK